MHQANQMDFTLFGVYCFLLLHLSIANANQISFQKYCIDGSQPDAFPGDGKMSSGSIVMSSKQENGTWYQPNLNCSVTFTSQNNFLLLLTFSNVSLRNSSMDNLTVLYDSGKSEVVLYGQQVCSNENCQGLKFDSGEFNNITLKFISANVSVPTNVTGFRAHYTVYNLVDPKNGACRKRNQFLCGNGHCIWGELVCDGHNNCGDRSDETKCIIPVSDTVWGIAVIVIAVLCVIIFVPLFCCLAISGTRSVVKSVTLATNQATPLLPTTDCGETSGLLTSSDAANNCWPATSYERRNSFSYGTSEPSTSNDSRRKFRSLSEVQQPERSNFL